MAKRSLVIALPMATKSRTADLVADHSESPLSALRVECCAFHKCPETVPCRATLCSQFERLVWAESSNPLARIDRCAVRLSTHAHLVRSTSEPCQLKTSSVASSSCPPSTSAASRTLAAARSSSFSRAFALSSSRDISCNSVSGSS